MTVKSPTKRRRVVRRLHLKYRGIKPSTRARYARQLTLFLSAYGVNGRAWPSSWDLLDQEVAEHINMMYHEGEPHGYAGDLLSALSRWLPKSRHKLPTARLWFKNWAREICPSRALPMPVHVVRGLAGIALAMGRTDLAVLLPVAFLCLLRTSEILRLCPADVAFSQNGSRAILRLRNTKTSGAEVEEVVLHDAVICRALAQLCSHSVPHRPILSGSSRKFGDDLRWLARSVGFSHPLLLPYSLRRGGATWHFHEYGSLSLTTARGRWIHERTAKIYINGAAAEWASWVFTAKASATLARAAAAFTTATSPANVVSVWGAPQITT